MDAATVSQARALLPRGAIYADWAASALPLPHASSAPFLAPVHNRDTPHQHLARCALRAFLGDSAHAFHVIFTSGATDALRTLAHRLPWAPADAFVCHAHAHNAVRGIRNEALNADAAFRSVTSASLERHLRRTPHPSTPTCPADAKAEAARPPFAVLAYPAECNLTGTTFPFRWAREAKRCGLYSYSGEQVITLLDTAKLAASSPLVLDDHTPYVDAVVFSLYKLSATFTGLGALLVRRDSLLESLLKSTAASSYFAGGLSVDAVSPFSPRLFAPSADLRTQLELGTPNIQAIHHLPSQLARFSPPSIVMAGIHAHAAALAALFSSLLTEVFTPRGVKIHRDAGLPADEQTASTVVAFTLYRIEGRSKQWHPIGHNEIGTILKLNNVYARTGCMCNAGACCSVLGLTDVDVAAHFAKGHRCGDAMDVIDGKPTGLVRISFGWGSRSSDVHAILNVLRNHISYSVYGPLGEVDFGTAPSLSHFVVRSLHVYPVKSCAGTSVKKITFDKRGGILGDRRFAIQQAGSQALLSLKTCPILADLTAWLAKDETCLVLELHKKRVLPGMPRKMAIDLGIDSLTPKLQSMSLPSPTTKTNHLSSEEHEATGKSAVGGEELSQWLSSVAGRPVRLVGLASQCSTTPTSCKTSEDVLIVSETEIEELRSTAGIDDTAVVREALRPNIVLGPALEGTREQYQSHPPMNVFKSFNADGLHMVAKRSCVRCTVVNTVASARGFDLRSEPLRSIARINRRRQQKGLVFGVLAKAVPDAGDAPHHQRMYIPTHLTLNQEVTGSFRDSNNCSEGTRKSSNALSYEHEG